MLRRAVKRIVPRQLFHRVEPYGHWGEAVVQQVRHGFPARDLQVIGVTGTSGKSTTCVFITQLLRANGYKVAMMTTVGVDYGDGHGLQPNPTRLTTMGVGELLRTIQKVKAAGAEWLVLETTSHALAQHRVWAIPYSIAVFTNLSPEHLDYHGTFERYRAAKRLLFSQTDRNHRGLRVGVVNADDPNAAVFASAIAHPLHYGLDRGELRARDIRQTPAGTAYTVSVDGEEYHVTCHIPGKVNVYNSLAALAVGRAIGLTPKQIEKGIAALQAVEGRMTVIDEGQDFTVLVDYAHTPESFERLFKEFRSLTKGRLIAVFGWPGRRNEAQRAEQGRVAGRLCDVVVVTEDDDRDIDGTQIRADIAAGAQAVGKTEGKDLFVVPKREAAVEQAIGLARRGDVVLLLSKGHEKSILTNGPQAAALRHLPPDDADPRRVVKRPYDEIAFAHQTLRHSTQKQRKNS